MGDVTVCLLMSVRLWSFSTGEKIDIWILSLICKHNKRGFICTLKIDIELGGYIQILGTILEKKMTKVVSCFYLTNPIF